VTLGSVRTPRNRHALTQRLREAVWQPPPAWRAASLTLYQSVLSSTGPRYTVLAEVPLAPEGSP
jgi:2'-5' RNA ligase